MRSAFVAAALALPVLGCGVDDPPALDRDPTAPTVTSDTLPPCRDGSGDTVHPAGCLDPDGRVVRP